MHPTTVTPVQDVYRSQISRMAQSSPSPTHLVNTSSTPALNHQLPTPPPPQSPDSLSEQAYCLESSQSLFDCSPSNVGHSIKSHQKFHSTQQEASSSDKTNLGGSALTGPSLSRSPSLRSNLSFSSTLSSPPSSQNSLPSSSSSSSPSNRPQQPIKPNPQPPSTYRKPLSQSQPRSLSPFRSNLAQASTTTPPPSSKNDIFSVSLLPQPSPTPSSRSSAHPPNSASSSFSISNAQTQSPQRVPTYSSSDLNRLSSKSDLKLCLTKSYRLGEGTHGTVYLAALRPQSSSKSGWKLCAAKISQDYDTTVHEGLVFERLQRRGNHQSILRFHGLKSLSQSQLLNQLRSSPQPSSFSSRLSSNPAKSIALLLDYCPLGDLFCFVRNTLNQWHDSNPEARSGLISLDRKLWIRWASELVDAIDWCQKSNVIVGDLKPHNILLDNQLRIQLSDFDRSIIVPSESDEDSSLLIDPQGTGTSAYSAPELVQPPPSPFSYPADVFALGVTLYFILTGREPYQSVKSPVERMLLISRGAFWEHESNHRWSTEPGHSNQRSLHRLDSSNVGRLRSVSSSTEPGKFSELYQGIVDPISVERLLGHPPEPIEIKFEDDEGGEQLRMEGNSTDQKTNGNIRSIKDRFENYSDGSPALRFLTCSERVDESIMKLIGSMCSPQVEDRPSLEFVKDQLKLLR